eukprot:gnl/MRDRNA2_/MRDRNA2_29422_c0_seq1.p1 gnl/MRDRNA2_/MRDRNA2_29422_c0~~gnl/MRDRNA2_/MRDRNA2_29422_c0_seq1.p1  ORF type:complete len:1031 (+),score=355.64 gnl/MRDRNA2_/MRDRNA2_29422_c0_seq1:288-3095(+)
MKEQMEKDADADEDTNEEMLCWCKQNDKALTKAIADNTELSAQLTSEIEELRAKSDQLNTEIETINKEVDENQKALETATAMRKKDMHEFNAAESSTATSIKQIDGAVAAIAAGTGKAMMQQEITLDEGSHITKALKLAKGHGDVLWALHNEKERQIIAKIMSHQRDLGFIQTDATQTTQQTVIKAPSDIIYGTLRGMSDAFKENLAKMQQDENDAQAKHEALKKGKTEEIDAGVSMVEEKTATLADTDERAASARTELDDTNEALAQDTEFLAKVKEQCAFHEKVYAQRKADRALEVEAVNAAVGILTADHAKDLFTKTLGHTRRGAKLGSRDLAEFKEERDTESMRSQTNKARKAQWGTAERYLLLQPALVQIQEHDFVNDADFKFDGAKHITMKKNDLDKTPDAKKLAEIAQRTEQYWKSKYYMEATRENATLEELKKVAKEAHEHHHDLAVQAIKKTKEEEKRNKLGLTAAEAKVRKNDMSAAGQGVTKMRKALEIQQGEEMARRDWCQDEIIASEKQLDNLARDKKDHEEKIKLMAKRMERLTYEIKQMRYDQEDADIETQKAANDRKKECTSFQRTVMNHKKSKELLQMAKTVLESVYDKAGKKAALIRQSVAVHKGFLAASTDLQRVGDVMYNNGGAEQTFSFKDMKERMMKRGIFLQKDAGSDKEGKPTGKVAMELNKAKAEEDDAEALIKAGEAAAHAASVKSQPVEKAMLQGAQEPSERVRAPPPPGFSGSAAKQAGSGGVLTMIENIMEDTQAMIEESVKGETEAMKAYETFVKEANDATNLRNEGIVERQTEIGKLEQFTQEEKVALSETINVQREVRQYNIDLYGVEGCQFLLKNYEVRYIEREEEINSLKEAEAILGAGGGDPKMAAATGKNDPSKNKAIEYTPTEDGLEAEGEVEGAEKKPHDEHAIIHMAGGTQDIDTK